MFGNYTGATNAGSKTAAVEIEENSIRDVRKIRRSNTFTSLEPVKCKRFDFVKETAELLDVATHQRRPPVVRPLSKASGTGSGSMEKLPVKTRNTSDSSVQRYLDGIYGGSAAVVHPGINRNLVRS